MCVSASVGKALGSFIPNSVTLETDTLVVRGEGIARLTSSFHLCPVPSTPRFSKVPEREGHDDENIKESLFFCLHLVCTEGCVRFPEHQVTPLAWSRHGHGCLTTTSTTNKRRRTGHGCQGHTNWRLKSINLMFPSVGKFSKQAWNPDFKQRFQSLFSSPVYLQ